MSYVMVAAAVVGAAKSQFVDKPEADRKRTLLAETQRLAPYTGLKGEPVKEPDMLGSALAFGATGSQMSNGMKQQGINDRIAERFLAPEPNYDFTPYEDTGMNWQPQPTNAYPWSIMAGMKNTGG